MRNLRAALARAHSCIGLDEAFVEQLGERLAPVVADRGGWLGPASDASAGRSGRQIVATPRAGTVRESRSSSRDSYTSRLSQKIAYGGCGVERLQQSVADLLQVDVERGAIVVVEHEALGADGRRA